MKQETINNLRRQIDKEDIKLISALKRRIFLAKKVKILKNIKNLPTEDKKREKQIIKKLSSSKINKNLVKRIYQLIFKYTRKK